MVIPHISFFPSSSTKWSTSPVGPRPATRRSRIITTIFASASPPTYSSSNTSSAAASNKFSDLGSIFISILLGIFPLLFQRGLKSVFFIILDKFISLFIKRFLLLFGQLIFGVFFFLLLCNFIMAFTPKDRKKFLLKPTHLTL